MDAIDQLITDEYSLVNGDCVTGVAALPDNSVHFSIYSPPFATLSGACLYQYSSSHRDFSNCNNKDEFFDQYRYLMRDITRVTLPGRMSAVHCTDIPRSNSGCDGLYDFPGDIIRLHEEFGWELACRHGIWKEPLGVRNRTMQKNLAHMTLVEDSIHCGVASMDQLLMFRKKGKNPIPVAHPVGMLDYIGERQIPQELYSWRGWDGDQKLNRFSHWIWRQYASSFWDDIRLERVLPYREAREEEDEKHVHPLQLDVIERAIVMRTNPGEVVLTPFMGVGSEVYGAVRQGRKGIGFELKTAYYRQAIKNLAAVEHDKTQDQGDLFSDITAQTPTA